MGRPTPGPRSIFAIFTEGEWRSRLVHRCDSTRLGPASLVQAVHDGVEVAVEQVEAAPDGGRIAVVRRRLLSHLGECILRRGVVSEGAVGDGEERHTW